MAYRYRSNRQGERVSHHLNIPQFAVVGHPNKGKSSIVAALTQNDEVTISPVSGTTRKHRSYVLEADGEPLLELVDTPGFQRARSVLAWLKEREKDALSRPEAVRLFVETFKDDPHYADEIELLKPIVEGAGIIYVVDGSKPYGAEYEAEMEILRWTARPSMAVINRIGEGDYTEAWRTALNGYFNIVRTYNPVRARLDDHLRLLESMAHTDERHLKTIERAAAYFKADFMHKLEASARIVADTTYDALRHKTSLKISGKKATDEEKRQLLQRYEEALRRTEESGKTELKRLWRHMRLHDDTLARLDENEFDLFSEESASIFGLSRRELLAAGAIGGAATGAGVDLLFLGHTLFVGGAVGAAMGAAGAYFAFDKLADMRILGMRAGDYRLVAGPIKDRNFPYILSGRLLFYAFTLASLSHAYRDEVTLIPDESFKERWLDAKTKKELEKLFAALREGKEDEQTRERLREIIRKRLVALLKEEGVV
jgi:small GTP-binding protein